MDEAKRICNQLFCLSAISILGLGNSGSGKDHDT